MHTVRQAGTGVLKGQWPRAHCPICWRACPGQTDGLADAVLAHAAVISKVR